MIWPQFGAEELGMLASIYECPRDAVRFLVYADWLEERGDPLAEFIRVQCELEQAVAGTASHAALKKRERVVKRGRVNGWREYTRGRGFNEGFRRGLPVIGWRCWDRYLEEIDAAVRQHTTPRHGVDLGVFVRDENELFHLFDLPIARQLRRLHLVGPLVPGPRGDWLVPFKQSTVRRFADLGLAARLEEFLFDDTWPLATPSAEVQP